MDGPASTSETPPGKIRLRADYHAQLSANGALEISSAEAVHLMRGPPAELLRALFPLLDGTRNSAEIIDALAPRFPKNAVLAVLKGLASIDAFERTETPAQPLSGKRLLILSNGLMGRAIERDLVAAGARAERVGIRGFRSCLDPDFVRCVESSVLHDAVKGEPAGDPDGGIDVDTRTLSELFDRADLVIAALEGVRYRALLDINQVASRHATPCLFARIKFDKLGFVGPIVSRVPGACLSCLELSSKSVPVDALASIATTRSGIATVDDGGLVSAICRRVVEECAASFRSDVQTELIGSAMWILDGAGAARPERLLQQGACPTCRERVGSPAPAATVMDLELLKSTASVIAQRWPSTPNQSVPEGARPYRTVGIIGGGTAGYLTALILRAQRPDLEVTLIESSAIPVIGVGEATTPELVKFLHAPRFLDRDIVDFYRRVIPTWKLGIKFEWGEPDPYFFTFPFQRGRLLESEIYEKTLNKQSLGSMLMALDRAPVFRSGDGGMLSMMHTIRWAYHLDNVRFVRYLTEEARKSGVKHIDAKVTEVRVAPDGENVEGIVLDGRDLHTFDLYVDSSGFQSLLLDKALKVPFQSYASTLFTDRAIAAEVPNGGLVRPYTTAETMDAGWCWRIPFLHEDHRGYVFSSAFMSDEDAAKEMRSKNPGLGETRVVRFRSGRHDVWWKGNVAAVGNSYAFVEPLESTALHMIVLQLEILATHLPACADDRAVKEALNRKVGEQWDRLRWFLGCHYRFNRRLDTPFWRAARNETDISGAEDRVRLLQERAPLSYRSPLSYKWDPPDFFSDDHSFDTILCGQRVPARFVRPVEDPDSWRCRVHALESMARCAVSQSDAIHWLIEERPDVLQDFRSRADCWLHAWLPA